MMPCIHLTLSFQKNFFYKTSRRSDYLSPRLLQLCLSWFACRTNRLTAESSEQCSSAHSEKKQKRDHITPLLNELHWLPVKFRCEYKIATLAYHHFDRTLPSYLSASLCTYQTSGTLRSSNEKLLKIPKLQSQICWSPVFQFYCSNCLEFAACQLAESPHPL